MKIITFYSDEEFDQYLEALRLEESNKRSVWIKELMDFVEEEERREICAQ